MKKRINLYLLFLSIVPFVCFSQPEDSFIRKFLITIPADLSDDAAIEQLKNKNFSKEAKSEVNSVSACEIKRYKLALFMMDGGYIKLSNISQFFNKPFSDGAPNSAIISNHFYPQQESIKYLQAFIDKGVPVTKESVVNLFNKPEYSEVFEFLKGKLPEKDRVSFDQEILLKALYKDKVDYNEIISLLNNSKAKVTPDILTKIKLDNLDVVKLLVEKGADINFKNASETPLMISALFVNPEVVTYLLEKGADPCYEPVKARGPLAIVKGNKKYCKTDKRRDEYDQVIKILKKAKKKC